MENNQPNGSLEKQTEYETYEDKVRERADAEQEQFDFESAEEARQEAEEEAHSWKQIGENLYVCEHCNMEMEASE
jgi:hypothetical protein